MRERAMSDEERASRIKRVVLRTTVASAALGVVLSPIPLADELVLLPVYGLMATRIGRAHGLGLTSVPWRPIFAAVAAGLASRAAVNVAFAFIPGVAAVANAVSAAALTQALGSFTDTACREGVSREAAGVPAR